MGTRRGIAAACSTHRFADAYPAPSPDVRWNCAMTALGQDGRVTADRLDPDASHERYVATVVEEGERFGVLARELGAGRTPVAGGLDVPVPWVPEWTVRQLVAHLGAVHRWATAILRAGTVEAPEPSSRFRPPDDDLAGWYALGLTELVATLRTVDPDAPAWHMSPAASRRAREWGRRQAHELVVHRLDLEAAAGVAHAPLDPQLAADGVDELLGIMLPRWQHTPPLDGARAVVAVTATDVGRSWRVEVADGTVRTGRAAPGEPVDATLTGIAEMLLRRVWGRPADVTVSGDPAAESLLRGR